MTTGMAWYAGPVLVLPAPPGASGRMITAAPNPTGERPTPHGAATPTVGGGSATTGAAGSEAASVSTAPTPPKGAEPSAAGSPAPAVLADEASFVAEGLDSTDRAFARAHDTKAATHST
jgi:hypothetical protein